MIWTNQKPKRFLKNYVERIFFIVFPEQTLRAGKDTVHLRGQKGNHFQVWKENEKEISGGRHKAGDYFARTPVNARATGHPGMAYQARCPQGHHAEMRKILPYPQLTVPALCHRSPQGDTRASGHPSGCNFSPGLTSGLMLKHCSCSQNPRTTAFLSHEVIFFPLVHFPAMQTPVGHGKEWGSPLPAVTTALVGLWKS